MHRTIQTSDDGAIIQAFFRKHQQQSGDISTAEGALPRTLSSRRIDDWELWDDCLPTAFGPEGSKMVPKSPNFDPKA